MIAVSEEQLKIVKDILNKYVPACEVRAFGSRYKWTNKDYSDLDLAIVGDGKMDWKLISDVKEAFQESELPFRVDVLDWNKVSEEFREVIGEGYEVIQISSIDCGVGCNDWREMKLGDVVDSIAQRHKKALKEIVLVNTSDVLEGKVLNHKLVKNENLKGQFKKSFQKDDILYSEIRPQNRRFAFIDFESENYIASTKLMVLRRKNDNIIPEFLYQKMRSDEVISELQTIAESRSGTFPQITYSELSKINIKLPSCQEQKAIAATLSCLDDKIELNNLMNKTLEEMAQAIFKSWFVDFEPFQDGEFEDSELGMIPKGWRISRLDEIANFLNGLAMQKYRSEIADYLPVIKIKELNQEFTDSNSDRAKLDIPPQYIIDDGDVIFSWSGTLLVKLWCGGKGALNQHLFKVTSDKYEKWFLYFWTLFHLEKFRAIASDKATTMGHINRGHLSDAKVVIPDVIEIEKMNIVMKSIFNQLIAIKVQNKKLKEIRETLLPKLMSGEVRLP